MTQLFRLSFYFSLVALTIACANVIPPSGGVKDTKPPALDTLRSTPNFQTNFQKQTIELSFDEWVKLQDVFKEVVISPPLDKQAQIILKGKTVKIIFDESEQLKPNATYTINFGTAIKDLTEGNVAKDLRFVFSTGPFIDSLKMSGSIVDAFTGKPVPNALFLLYDNLADSVVRSQRPFYFGRADQQGSFTIQNVRADTFKAFALLDANLNYLYDQPAEMIGFPEGLVVVSGNKNPFVQVRLSTEKQNFKIQEDAADIYGYVKVKFTGAAKEVTWTTDLTGAKIYTELEQDSLQIWYDLNERRSWNLFLQKDTSWRDTVKVRAFSKDEFLKTTKLEPAGKGLKGRSGRGGQAPKAVLPTLQKLTPVNQNPDRPLILDWNFPLERLDTGKIILLEDTARILFKTSIKIDSSQRRRLSIAFPWKEEKNYSLQLLPGALTDWYGRDNDSIVQPISVASRKAFGSINLVVEDLNANESYILQILTSGGELVEQFNLKQSEDFKKQLNALTVGAYLLRLIQDKNGNGVWDPADYGQKIQPEKVFLQTIEQLRANWELEIKLSTAVFIKTKIETVPAGGLRKKIGER